MAKKTRGEGGEKHGGAEKNGRSRSKRRGNYNKDENSNSDTDSVLNDTASVGSGYSSAELRRANAEANQENGGAENGDFVLIKTITPLSTFFTQISKITVQDILEHGLKRADDEAGAAAVILSLVLITLGSTDYCDELYRELFPTLDRLFMDTKAKPHVRAKCATALSLGCFITDSGLEKSRQVLGQLLAVGFTTVKGHPDPGQLTAIAHLRAACLDNFSFLVSVEADDYLVDALEENIDQLAGCLDSPYLGLRVAAGEAIALLVERARAAVDEEEDGNSQDNFYLAHFDEICAKLQSLATDSQKSKSKKELREQRLNFRQILKTVEGERYGEETVKVGHQERVLIGCWQSRRYYDTFCSVLGSGMSLHLTQNVLLRDIFDMGAVAPEL
ncbi:PREDICTED: interferon-related developmental regulator 2-like, partial [Rhagoletis zephyria]|uniref:interferon-related developmental regulator 2-like n=1 Tax=Rhagoletis zephyria TaxID=28612 RepID=UPI000811348A